MLVLVCVGACACVRVCVSACVRACVRACVCVGSDLKMLNEMLWNIYVISRVHCALDCVHIFLTLLSLHCA